MGARRYSSPESWAPRVIASVSTAFSNISIASVSGALLGKIRTDVQKTIVSEIEFTNDANGCADFVLRLNALPDFPILPFSLLTINIGDTDYDWYCGVVDYTDELGTKNGLYEFKGKGVRSYFETLRALTTYNAPLDLGEIVYDIVETWIVPYAPIRLNSAKINTVTGTVLANDIDLSNSPISKILQTLADMCGHDWGVDGDRDLYFLPRATTIRKTFFIGYDLEEFKPKLNISTIKNAIVVQRQEGKGSGGAGWSIAGIYNDPSSIKKYGKKELTYQVPGYFDDSDCALIGQSILDESKDPTFSAQTSGLKIIDGESYMERGTYRFILPYDRYSEIYSDVDSASEWSRHGTGNLSISDCMDFFVHGEKCIQLSYTDAFHMRAELIKNFKGNIKKIRFYIRSNRRGSFLTVGVGLTNWNEYTTPVDIPLIDTFFNFDWDVSSLSIYEINKFALSIDEGVRETPVKVYIDKIELQIDGFKTYHLLLTNTKYTLKPNQKSSASEFGTLPPKMENYLAGLLEAASELKFTQEIR